MVMSALDRLLRQVAWGPLDYLIIDTPPGTGDTHLSLVQNLPIAGTLLVTTPQKAAVDVTRRGAEMYNKVNVPLAGIVSNMTTVTCPNCKTEVALSKNETDKLAKELGKYFNAYTLHFIDLFFSIYLLLLIIHRS